MELMQQKPTFKSKIEKANEMRINPTLAEQQMLIFINSNIAPRFPDLVFEVQSVRYGYILDFYYPTLKLAIEIDGSLHNDKRGHDWIRQTHLERRGIQVLRASNTEVFNNPQDIANALCNIIEEKRG